jgi:serine/threonine protein phosphatase PrpC
MGLRHCHFFAVCDGHGSNGREVSALLKHRLPLLVETQLKTNLANHDLTTYPQFESVRQSLHEAFKLGNAEVSNSGIDVRFSGSTCVSVMTYARHLYMANVGDSRAIIAR